MTFTIGELLLVLALAGVYFVIGRLIASIAWNSTDEPMRNSITLLWPTILVLYLVYMLMGGGRKTK